MNLPRVYNDNGEQFKSSSSNWITFIYHSNYLLKLRDRFLIIFIFLFNVLFCYNLQKKIIVQTLQEIIRNNYKEKIFYIEKILLIYFKNITDKRKYSATTKNFKKGP